MSKIEIFGLLYLISAAIMYLLFSRGGGSNPFPGDIFMKKGSRTMYLPVGSAFFLTIILYILLNMLKKKAGV